MCGFSLVCSSGGGSAGLPSWAANFRFSGDMASKLCGGTGLWVPRSHCTQGPSHRLLLTWEGLGHRAEQAWAYPSCVTSCVISDQ